MSVNRVKLNVCGSEYTITSDEPIAYVESLGKQVDSFMDNLIENNAHISTTMAAVLAAITFADEAQKASNAADNLRAQMKEYLDDNARIHMECDSLRRELDAARRELEKHRGSDKFPHGSGQ